MNLIKGILTDLRARRLWPFMLVLVVALVAVPVLLAKSSSAPSAPVSVPPPTAHGPSLPLVVAETSPSNPHLGGRERDPFGGGPQSAASPSSGSAKPSSHASSGAAKPSTGTGGGSPSQPSGTAGGAPTSATSPSPAPTPIAAPPASGKPGPATLTDTQAYRVSVGLTYPSGALNTIDPLERLSVLPSDSQPLLVELGVLRGGRRVLFEREPGYPLPSDPSGCIPGPSDCQILSLAVGQEEELTSQSASGTTNLGLFAVTGIHVKDYGSPAAAMRARREASAAGRAVLASSQDALGLFRYEPREGAVVDLRNVSIGGN